MTQATELTQRTPSRPARSAAGILSELDQEAPKFSGLVLAVCFVSKAKLIAVSDNHRDVKLDAALAEGGEPIGLIGYTVEKGCVRFYSRLLREYAGQTWASDLLECLLMKFMNSVSESLGSKDFEAEPAWLN